MATVATDPVTAGQPATALTWTYGYSGDLLSSVCPPGTSTACTSYGYVTNGSHAPTSVLNANPTSYYRLDEAAGTRCRQPGPGQRSDHGGPAGRRVQHHPRRVRAGPGVTATGFNGTSSWIPLDGAWCTTPGQVSSCIQPAIAAGCWAAAESLAVSVWFKTSTASGVLLGLTTSLPASTAPSAPPRRRPCCGSAATATCRVTIGETVCFLLHSVRDVLPGRGQRRSLAPGGAIPGQALYLDGVEVATGTASVGLPAGDYALLGAGCLVPPR